MSDPAAPPSDEEPEPADGELILPERLPPMAMPESTPAEFQLALDGMRDKREALYAFIRSQLRKGVDYDTVGRSNKNTLLKPGSEKIAAVLQLRPVFVKDAETMEMLQAEPGVVCYCCTLVTTDGVVIGEGRGACEPSERPGVNTRVKIALKRAQVDAVLRVAALSDHFTQDLEDGTGTPAAAAPAPPAKPARPPRPADPPRQAPRPNPQESAPPAPSPSESVDPRTGRSTRDEDMAALHDREEREQREAFLRQQGHEGVEWKCPDPAPSFEAKDRDGNAVAVVGKLHHKSSEEPTQRRQQILQHFFAPSDHVKAKFTREAPFTTWCGMKWGELARYALDHRVERAKGEADGEETNRFNDPLLAILGDSFACFFRGQPTKLAETAAAANGIVWDAFDKAMGA